MADAVAKVIRFCAVCKTADDSPRHDIFGTDPNVAPHFTCCASVGCPDGSCDIVIRDASDKKGASLVDHITDEKYARKTQELLDARDPASAHFTHADLDQSVHGAVTQAFITLQPSGE